MPYEFSIVENLEPNTIAWNVSIFVEEIDKLPIYKLGFNLELLYRNLSISNDIFELVPNYGIGRLVATVKLKSNKYLDYEKGQRKYELTIKATCRSSPNLVSYANLTINIKDFNEYNPYFDTQLTARYLNEPESYNVGDIITKVLAYDGDSSDESLTYSIIGPHKDRFNIDSSGQIRLLKKFDFSNDKFTFYNLTVLALDQGGLSNVTNLLFYFNITTPFGIRDNLFECALNGARSELNQFDKMTLIPELYIPVILFYFL